MTIDIQNLQSKLKTCQTKYERAQGQLTLLKSQLEEKMNQHGETLINLNDWNMIQILFTETSEFAREQLKTRIENTVTAALQSIIDDSDLRFKVEVDQKGGQAVADWKIVSRYGDEYVAESPEDARGGGISDIVSIALRLALLELARPEWNEGILVADEPGKHVSADYAPNLAAFLQEYSVKTGRQILMTTHNRDLAEVASRQYQVGRDNTGNSEVKAV